MAVNETPTWAHDRIAAMDAPADWRPDAGGALERLTARRDRRRRRVRIAWQAVTAAAVVALLASAPSVKLAAGRAWDVLFARDVSVLRVDIDRLPAAVRQALQANVNTDGLDAQSVVSLDEASRRSGFTVRTVPSTLLPETPKVSVVSPLSAELTLRVDDLTRAAQSAGVAADVVINPHWDDARLRVETSHFVLSEYGLTTLAQGRPLTISMPPGFDMPAFVQVAMRLLGYNAAQASALSQRVAAAPVMFLGVPPNAKVRVSEVSIGSQMGTLMRDADEGSLTLIWSTDERLYVLTGPIDEQLALSVAGALE